MQIQMMSHISLFPKTGVSLRLGAVLMSAFLISGCAEYMKERVKNVDKQAELEEMAGPDSLSMERLMKKNAHEAEAMGRYRKAAESYQQLSTMSPKNTEYKILHAESLRKAGDYNEAIKLFNQVLTTEPEHIDAMEGKALALMGVGRLKEANRYLKEVLAKGGARWRALNAAGVSLALKKKPNEAIEYFKAALDAEPNNTTVLNNIGLTLAFRKDYDKAAKYLERASMLLPKGSRERRQVDLNLSLIYGLQGDVVQAEQYARPYLNDAELYNNMGLFAHLAEDDSLARSYLNMALTQSPVYYDKAWKNLNRVQHPEQN